MEISLASASSNSLELGSAQSRPLAAKVARGKTAKPTRKAIKWRRVSGP